MTSTKRTALELTQVRRVQRFQVNLFNDGKLDEELSIILSSRGITEIYGCSSAGKSTICMQIMLNYLKLNDPNIKALYISTDSSFCIHRLLQLQPAVPLNRILIQHLGDLETQEHFLCYFLYPLVVQQQIGMIILDSISANFRVIERTWEVTRSLYLMAKSLNELSRFGLIIICTNQITNQIAEDGKGEKGCPALGLSWSNCVTNRIELERTNEGSLERTLKILRCPNTFPSTHDLLLADGGFVIK